jgi:hypothetical protein
MTEYLITTVAGGYDDGSNAKLTATLETLFNPPTAPPVTPPAQPPPTAPSEPAAGKARLSSRDEPSSFRERLRKPLDLA